MPKRKPFLTATLIGRNEAHNVERCLSSIWPHVDEIVYVDTGSKDGTSELIDECHLRLRTRHPGHKVTIRHASFTWVDDFAAARNHADSLATGEWIVWADLDDEVIGLGNLRKIAERADPNVVAYFAHYNYAQTSDGACISELWRERMVRNGAAMWEGRLHEHKIFTSGEVIQIPQETVDWVHHRAINDQGSGLRNRRILEAWDREEPDNPRIIQSLALEYMGAADWEQAIDTLTRYLTFDTEQPERRSQASRYLVQALTQLGRFPEARKVAYKALEENWRWADTHLSLAEIAQAQGEPDLGYHHAKRALDMGKPQSILILNPLQYTAHPRAIMAVCCMAMQRYDEAMRLVAEVQSICDYPLISAHLPSWQGTVLREQAVGAWTACADLLRQYGDLLKARDLLETLPYFAKDDPRVIAKRVELWQAVESVELGDLPLEPESAAAKFVVRHVKEAA